VLGYGFVVTLVVMVFAILLITRRGDLRTSLILKKPLLVPAIAFIVTILIVMAAVPLPMSVYHGANQRQTYESYSGRFQVYDSIAYEEDLHLQLSSNDLNAEEWIGVYANFSQEGVVVLSLFANLSDSSLENNTLTRDISLNPGVYDVEIDNMLFAGGNPDEPTFIGIILYQSLELSFLPQITEWSSYQLLLGFGSLFLLLGGICIGGEEKTRRSAEKIDQEPPRDELYTRRHKV
jgi:hypothetical protein